jgi:hypothetical protein
MWLEMYFERTLFDVMPIVLNPHLMMTNLPWNDLALVVELLFIIGLDLLDVCVCCRRGIA